MPAISVVLPVVIDISASVVKVFGENVTNTNPYSITANGANLLASDLSGFFWYIQDASGANPDLVSCWVGKAGAAPLDKDGNALTHPIYNKDADLVAHTNAMLDNYVLCDGSAFAADYSSLPSSAYSSTNPMYKFANLYQALLGRMAFDIFGHPLAQAGIENDTELMNSMRDKDAGQLLYNALNALTEPQVRLLYEQMIQQDVSRFEDLADVPKDLSGNVLEHYPNHLRFLTGDSVTFEISFASSAVERGYTGDNGTGPSGNINVPRAPDADAPGSTAGLNVTSTVAKTYALNVTLA
jgi:hypothetical protein